VLPTATQTGDPKNTQAYLFLVRAVDSEGGLDPSPATIGFTQSTLLPSIFVDRPPLFDYLEAQPMPPTLSFGFTGIDPDGTTGAPTQWRFLWKYARYDDPGSPLGYSYCNTWYQYSQLGDELISFQDSVWSSWIPYEADPLNRTITFPQQPMYDQNGLRIYYLFALQAMDEAGAVSLDLAYGQNVHNVYISTSLAPELTVYEQYLGTEVAVGINNLVNYEIVAGQPLNFSWYATAEAYFGEVVAYQYGWDIVDPADPNDPGWAVAPGDTPAHLYAPERTFSNGDHTFVVQCWDNSDQMTRITYLLSVVPIPDPSMQYPLLLIDDVVDQNSNAWPAADGIPLDNDVFRDSFWEDVLTGSGGVLGFEWSRDVVDTESQPLTYRDLVDYKAVLWTTRYAAISFIAQTFQPAPDGSQPFNWLDAYQQRVGNVFMAGSRAMNEFIESRNWMIPWVFDTDELNLECGGNLYTVGFGTEVRRGLLRYPYRAMGIAMLDQVTPRYNVYGQCGLGSTGNTARNPACVGVKALLLDADFKADHVLGGVFPDTIFTETTIDWKDTAEAYRDSLQSYSWGNDEFYDGNITDRATAWSPQDCDGSPCLEPMFHIYSRFDWVDDLHTTAGDPDWPHNIFDVPELASRCGIHALDGSYDNSLTTDHTLGFVSHKYDATKPSGVGDVMWGFDPYRFGHDEITGAIHWVLGEHFGLVMRP
jgi:hypothetical protein